MHRAALQNVGYDSCLQLKIKLMNLKGNLIKSLTTFEAGLDKGDLCSKPKAYL